MEYQHGPFPLFPAPCAGHSPSSPYLAVALQITVGAVFPKIEAVFALLTTVIETATVPRMSPRTRRHEATKAKARGGARHRQLHNVLCAGRARASAAVSYRALSLRLRGIAASRRRKRMKMGSSASTNNDPTLAVTDAPGGTARALPRPRSRCPRKRGQPASLYRRLWIEGFHVASLRRSGDSREVPVRRKVSGTLRSDGGATTGS